MTTPPPLPDQDGEHLKLLAIFHFVLAGLSLLGMGFLLVHYLVMSLTFGNPEMWKNATPSPPFDPAQISFWMLWIYLAFGIFILGHLIANLLAGIFLLKSRRRMFTLVVAGINCLQVPFGTALGVFTIVVLSQESVVRRYQLAQAGK